ncbi:hypothetical protein [Parafilimonas terrae]|uniref:Uncharacterized protein n=1 Tax=Parafilimonas terrae TaxID=1465490 RepID=A0A1I5YLJ1_9BACT|nr:hypothetical protein [Parafilimonas terrae]SFQ45050.1 hypothetical protein SAMN05444277_1133 [Parafilimonas terrae]
MTRLTIPYSIIIIFFGLFTTLMILASPHQVGKGLLTISVASLLIFILTGYFLYRSFSTQKNTALTICLLLLTAIIFGYFTYDIIRMHSDFSILDLLPIAAFAFTIFFIVSLLQKRHQRVKANGINNWEDYWTMFNQLCSSLNSDSKQAVVADLKKAQKHVNGLTDGWYKFLNEFKKAKEIHYKSFSSKQNDLADILIHTLESSLNSR